jgi:hypothetical protein
MSPLLYPLLCSGCVFAAPVDAKPAESFICQSAYSLDKAIRVPLRPYEFQPGDILFPTDRTIFWSVTHDLAGAFQPHHSGIVVARPDGSLGILEAGPHDTVHIKILEPIPSLKEYERKGPVWVRSRVTPLTEDQSRKLTEFAMKQEGKRFAIIRQGAQLTPFRSRGPLRTWFVGKPSGPDRSAYFCSELVTEALVAAGLIDAETARPAATYPRDLFMDHSYNLYINKHLKLAPEWDPPARWTSEARREERPNP